MMMQENETTSHNEVKDQVNQDATSCGLQEQPTTQKEQDIKEKYETSEFVDRALEDESQKIDRKSYEVTVHYGKGVYEAFSNVALTTTYDGALRIYNHMRRSGTVIASGHWVSYTWEEETPEQQHSEEGRGKEE